MKAAFLVTLLATGALLAILFLVPPANSEGGDLTRSEEPARQEGKRPSKTSIVDLSRARGTEAFLPYEDTANLDGKMVTFQSILLWAGKFAPVDGQNYKFEDVRVVGNHPPRIPEDLASLVRLTVETPLEQLGNEMNRLLDSGTPGLRAGSALFVGGNDLKSAKVIELEDTVKVFLVDRPGRLRKADLSTSKLTLELVEGKITKARTAESVSVKSEQGEVIGEGFEGDPRTGSIVIHHSIRGVLKDSKLLGVGGDPMELTAGGPLRYLPPEGSTPETAMRSGGTIILEGGVSLVQSDSRIRSQTLTAQIGGNPLRLLSLVLEGDVSAETPEGRFRGDRVTVEDSSTSTTLTFLGSPVNATWTNGARLLQGLKREGDLELTSIGPIVLNTAKEKKRRLESLKIGPDVVITANDLRITCRDMTVDFREIADDRPGAAAGSTRPWPANVTLSSQVIGASAELSFSGERLTYDRHFDKAGNGQKDVIELQGQPIITYSLPAPDEVATESKPDTLNSLLVGPGRVRLESLELIRGIRDLMRPNHFRLEARKHVLARRLGAGSDAEVQARFSSEVLDLDFEEVLDADPASAKRQVLSRLLVHEALGSGGVLFEVKDSVDGKADSILVRGVEERLELRGNSEPAMFTLHGESETRQTARAKLISYSHLKRTVVAENDAVASVLMAPLALKATVDQEPIPTEITATRVSVELFEESKDGRPRQRVRSASGSGGVMVRQQNGSYLDCKEFILDLEQRTGSIQGAPARIEVVRMLGGRLVTEHVTSAHMTLLDEQALLQGPVKGRFHADQARLAPRLDRRDQGSAASNVIEAVPIDLDSTGDVFFTKETIVATGPAQLSQGNPANDGFRLSGLKFRLFLGSTAPDSTRDIVKAAVDGNVVYDSPDIKAEGDSMVFDRIRKRIVLSGSDRPAYLSHRGLGLLRHPRPTHVIDFANPDRPFYESLDRPVGRPN